GPRAHLSQIPQLDAALEGARRWSGYQFETREVGVERAALVAWQLWQQRGIQRDAELDVAQLTDAGKTRVEVGARRDRGAPQLEVAGQPAGQRSSGREIPGGVTERRALVFQPDAFALPDGSADLGASHLRRQARGEPAGRQIEHQYHQECSDGRDDGEDQCAALHPDSARPQYQAGVHVAGFARRLDLGALNAYALLLREARQPGDQSVERHVVEPDAKAAVGGGLAVGQRLAEAAFARRAVDQHHQRTRRRRTRRGTGGQQLRRHALDVGEIRLLGRDAPTGFGDVGVERPDHADQDHDHRADGTVQHEAAFAFGEAVVPLEHQAPAFLISRRPL